MRGTYDTPDSAYGLTVSGDHAFVADWGSNLYVIQVFQSDLNSDSSAGRSLLVDGSSDAILSVRLTTTLIDEHRDAGSHDVTWNGRDAAGWVSAAGVYLYRLETGGYSETKRMVLIK